MGRFARGQHRVAINAVQSMAIAQMHLQRLQSFPLLIEVSIGLGMVVYNLFGRNANALNSVVSTSTRVTTFKRIHG